ncbi:MAG: FISUMP domain-containing protein [Cyclobacteriaceae bacterium]
MKVKTRLLITITIFSILPGLCQSTFVDSRDGTVYKTVKIGNLRWMAEDLKLETSSSHCPNFDEDGEDCKAANFYSYEELGSLCPDKWRIPTVDEWDQFVLSFTEVKTARMFEDNEKNFRVDFLNRYNVLESNILNIVPIGRTEGNVKSTGYYADYWTENPALQDTRFHMHISQFSIVGHAHKHNINERKEEKNRKFAVRCVCEECE